MNPATSSRPDLAPHQRTFVKAFSAPDAPQGFALRWPAGFGSMTAAIAIVHSCLQRNPKGRVLVLGPKALAEQTAYRLVSSGVRAEIVDRFFFRMLLDATPLGAEVWQGGNAFLLGIDFAKQEDVALSLCGVSWDLVVVIEADSLSGARENLLRRIVSASPQARLLLLASSTTRSLPTLGLCRWAYDEANLENTAITPVGVKVHPPRIKILPVDPTPSEERLNEFLDHLLHSLPKDNEAYGVLTNTMMRARRSGYAALEGVLRRIRNELAHGWGGRKNEVKESDSDLIDVDYRWAHELFVTPDVCALLGKILDQIELEPSDPKSTLLSEILGPSPIRQKTCIVTAYRATLSYLETALMQSGAQVFTIHSELSPEKAFDELKKFQDSEGLLAITSAALRPGVDLSFVNSLIIYDEPATDAKLKSLFECFEGPHRSAPLEVTIIDQTSRESS